MAMEGSTLHLIFLFCLYLDAEIRVGDRSQGKVLQTQAVDLDVKAE
jgi:hypothetical protein